MNNQAVELNELLKKQNRVVYSLLSKKGQAIYFPKKGILAQSADAKGKKINATIGASIEDDGSIMRLKSVEEKINISPEKIFPYAPSYGRLDLRNRWQEMILEKNPSLNKEEISLPVVTNALTHALSMIGYLFLNEGDTVILPDLYWGNYDLVFKYGYNVKFDTYNTFKNNKIDLDAFRDALNLGGVGKKIVVLNFPNNPTGYSPLVEESDKIADILEMEAKKGSEILVIVDDAYFGLVYEYGVFTESIFTKLINLHDNILAVKVDGATKEDYAWGFRIGFITYGIKNSTKELFNMLEQKTAGAVRGNISNASNLSQSVLLEAYDSDTYEDEKLLKNKLLIARYNKLKFVLKNRKDEFSEYFKVLPYNSGYFMCIKLLNNLDGEKIRNILLKEFDTGVINFKGIIRIAFSGVSENLIEKLFDNIYEACKKISNEIV